jgi:hypothetical protein
MDALLVNKETETSVEVRGVGQIWDRPHCPGFCVKGLTKIVNLGQSVFRRWFCPTSPEYKSKPFRSRCDMLHTYGINYVISWGLWLPQRLMLIFWSSELWGLFSRHTDWAEDWSVRGSNVAQEQDSSSSLTRPDRLWGPPILLFSSYMVSF